MSPSQPPCVWDLISKFHFAQMTGRDQGSAGSKIEVGRTVVPNRALYRHTSARRWG
jgi:hypothetical protein